MALKLVPYNNAMRLGQGFNSYTQEICVDNAVVGITSEEDSQIIMAGTSLPVVPLPPKPVDNGAVGVTPAANSGGVVVPPTGNPPVVPIATVPKDVNILGTLEAKVTRYPSQIVTFTSRYVNKLSDVASSLNISGSLSIKYGELSGGGSGSYVDSDTFQAADINFEVMVKVINQTINVKDQLDFYPLESHTANTTAVPYPEFVQIYGDSFISGFQEGGFFHAVVSMRSLNKTNLSDIKANAHVALQFGVGSVKADGQASVVKKKLDQECEVNITVNWAGGGQLKNSSENWTIDSLMAAAARFPELVAKCPQRTHAILTKYTALRGFLQWASPRKLSMLDYEIAQLYTDELMDVYLGYKAVWKDIHNMIEDLDEEKIIVKKSTTIKEPGLSPEFWIKKLDQEPLLPFEPTFEGLDAALRTTRVMMVNIVREVDDIKKSPIIATEATRVLPYIRPQVFRQLLPLAEPIVPPATPRSALTTKLNHGSVGFGGGIPSVAAIAKQALTRPYDAAPQLLYGLPYIDWAVLPNDGIELVPNTSAKAIVIDMRIDPIPDNARPLEKQIFNNIVKWIALPFNSKEFTVGTGRWELKTPETKPSLTQRCTFSRRLEDDPIVLSWLTGWRFYAYSTVEKWAGSVSASAKNPSRDGFDLVIDDIGAYQDGNGTPATEGQMWRPLFASAQWVAFPRNLTGIDGGTVEFLNLDGRSEVTKTSGRTSFRGGAFTKTPTIWFALSGFKYRHTGQSQSVPRIKMTFDGAIDVNGFSWGIETWEGEGVLEKATFTWIAFDNDSQALVTNVTPETIAVGKNSRRDILTDLRDRDD
ncbi:hypothetical protein QBC47DRAFT_418824 [Echria macrotheca]|uniref:H-type lectin domain-containing protein n=1 Tax=Echria macrotheca TaxID=438768 RepID=A0AAJ0B3A5_9PEZI|nr:hypothetical protein QBC47DRAFT_418824 [Echria macrotheca]